MALSAPNAAIVALFAAALAVLAAFQMWLVDAAMMLLLAGFALHENGEHEKVRKLESRISLAQVSSEELVEKLGKSISELSGAVSMLRGELQRVATNIESRVSSVEDHIRHGSGLTDAQKYYDIVQKIIELENRVSAAANLAESAAARAHSSN